MILRNECLPQESLDKLEIGAARVALTKPGQSELSHGFAEREHLAQSLGGRQSSHRREAYLLGRIRGIAHV